MRTPKTLVRWSNVFAEHTGNFVNLVMLRLKFQRQDGYFSNNNNNNVQKFLISKETRKPNEIEMRDFKGDLPIHLLYVIGCIR